MATSHRVGVVEELTLLTPIQPGPVAPGSSLTYTQRLRFVLASVQERIERQSPISLDGVPTLHYARWILLEGAHATRDGDQLLLTAVFNGTFPQYLRDLSSLVADDVNAIYSHCVGYPGISNFEAFMDYTRRHMIDTSVLYVARPHTEISVRDERRLLRENSERHRLDGGLA